MTVYQNGKIPTSALAVLFGKRGHPTLIAHLKAAIAEAATKGITVTVAAGQDIYRDIAGQTYWKAYWTRQGKPGNAAAVGKSNHGLGTAADITYPLGRKSEVVAIFAKHGLHFDVPSESWHVHDTTISTNGYDSINIVAPVVAKPKPATPAKTNGHATIRKGSKGKDVGIWQNYLHNNFPAYASAVHPDNDFGSKTDAATREWQRRNHLDDDGVVGHDSWTRAGI